VKEKIKRPQMKDINKKKFGQVVLIIIIMGIIGFTVGMQNIAEKEKELEQKRIGVKGEAVPDTTSNDFIVLDLPSLFGQPFAADIGGGVTQVFVIRNATHIDWYNYKDGQQIAAFSEEFYYDIGSNEFVFEGDRQPIKVIQGDITIGQTTYKKSTIKIDGDEPQ
jgi:hypothetical protein